MQRFKNVLFVTEGSKGEMAALQHLAEDIQAVRGKLTIIDVVLDAPISLSTPETASSLVQLQKTIVKEREAALKEMVSRLRKLLPNLKVASLVRQGTDYIEIIRQVQAGAHDLVAKVSGSTSRIEGMLFGTLDMNLLRKCPCPVLILKGHKKIKASKVLAAVDLVRHEPGRANLDSTVIDLAASIARKAEGSLDILHAWFVGYQKQIKAAEKSRSMKTVEALLKDVRESARVHMETMAADYADLSPGMHLIKGKPEDVIPRFAKNHGTHLVVMGTVGRTGIAGFFIGNTAEKILQGLNCSVLAVKPEGFKCPVE